MRKVAATALVLLFAEIAGAQIPTSGNVFFGYSYYNSNLTGGRISLNGWEGSIEGKVLPFIGLVGDFSGHYGSASSANCTAPRLDCGAFNGNFSQYNFLAGPRVSASVGKVRPFAEVLVGAAHVNIATTSTSFATAVGGGLDYRLLRVLAWRFQADYVHTHLFAIPQNNLRFSTGIVLRF